MTNSKVENPQTRILHSLEDTHKLAEEISQRISKRQVIGLQGEMGSGKTHFVKALAKALGIEDASTSSPTFAIHQQYVGKESIVHHLDLFRLESEDEIESSGFWDLFYETNAVLAVEWIDRIDTTQIPENYSLLMIHWKILENGDREVTLDNRR